MLKQPLEVLHRLSRSISQAKTLEEIYELILKEIVEVMDVERASIMRFDPKSQVLKIVAAKGVDPAIWKKIEISVGEGVSGRVWQEGKPVLIKQMKPNPRYKTHSYMIAPVTSFPMKVGQVPVGLVNLTDKKNGKPFTESDLKLLMTLSDQMASYMHIYDLVDRLKSAEQAKIELELAREIQQRLLPKKALNLKGVDLLGELIPAERVGADYYDYWNHGSNLGVCIADVSGHGVGGALLAFSLRACLKAQSSNLETPSPVVEQTNKMLFSDLFCSEQFISLFYAQYLPEKKTLVYTNAGHPPPLLWHEKEKRGEWLLTHDSLLGIEPNLEFHEKKLTLEKDDLLILYTDGLTEALGRNGERFGGPRLLKTIEKYAPQQPGEILQNVLGSWREFSSPGTMKDDVTVVLLKVV